jgi:hypothetical protein
VSVTVTAKRDRQSPLVAAAGLEEPRPERPGHSLIVQAWVIGAERAPVAYRIAHGKHILREGAFNFPRPGVAELLGGGFAVEALGFRTGASLVGLPETLSLSIRVSFDGDEYIELWELDLERQRVDSGPDGMQPLLVTTLGRTGSTLMTSVLEAHPEVSVHPVWAGRPVSPAEPRVLMYWLDVVRTLVAPTRYLGSLVPYDPQPGWALQDTDRILPYPLNDRIEESLHADQVERTIDFARSQIRGFYKEIAAQSEKARPRFFSEKFVPDRTALGMAIEFFPGAKQVILVRDFRDMVASILARNAKRGWQQGFGRKEDQTIEEYVRGLRGAVNLLALAAQDPAMPSVVVRYEDLVSTPESVLTSVFGELGLATSDEILEKTVAVVQSRSPASDDHRTVSDAAASVGRWRRDLSPSVQNACRDAFAGALAAFGYE